MRLATAVPSSAQYAWPGPRPVLAKSGPVGHGAGQVGVAAVDAGGQDRDGHALARRGRGAPGGGRAERGQPPFGRVDRAA